MIREYREQFCANTFDKLEEMGKFPEKHGVSKLSRGEPRWAHGAAPGCLVVG